MRPPCSRVLARRSLPTTGARDIPGNMARCTGLSGTRDSDISFCGARSVRGRRLCSSRSCTRVLGQGEALGNGSIAWRSQKTGRFWSKPVWKGILKCFSRPPSGLLTSGDEMDRCSSSDLTRIDGS